MNYRVYTPQHRRQRPQVAASAAEGHGDARVKTALHSWTKMMHSSSPLSFDSVIASSPLDSAMVTAPRSRRGENADKRAESK